MPKVYQLLTREHIASIRDVQKNPSKTLRGVTRVMRGSKTIGFYFSSEELDDLLEDLEAASSRSLRARVKKARQGLKKGDMVAISDLAREYGV